MTDTNLPDEADGTNGTNNETKDRITVNESGQCRHVMIDGTMVADFDVKTNEFIVFNPNTETEQPTTVFEMPEENKE